MPLISTLIDSFNDNVIGPEWGNFYGGVSEVGGKARIPCAAGAYAGYQTGPVYTLAGSSVYLQVPLAAPAAGATVEAQTVFAITPDPTKGTNLAININTVAPGTIRFESNVLYGDDTAVSLTYSAATHAWLRIRETGGNLLWDTSVDGTTWTNRRTLATPAWVTSAVNSLSLDLWCYRNNGTTNFSEFDNVNTLVGGAVVIGAAALSGASTLTGTATRRAIAAADLTAVGSLDALPRVTYKAAAALSATSTLEATAAADDADHVVNIGSPSSGWEVGAPWT